MDSLITNTLQPEGWIAYLQMVELIKCVYKTKYSKYKSIKKYDKRTKNLRIYIIDAGSNNNGCFLANQNSANHPYCFLSNQKKVQILAFVHDPVLRVKIVNFNNFFHWYSILHAAEMWLIAHFLGFETENRQVWSISILYYTLFSMHVNCNKYFIIVRLFKNK